MTREEDIKKAVEVLRKGGVILYPTDTVWGIGCDATNAEAVKRVYDIKQRDDSKAMICLVDSDARLQRYVRNVPDVAWQLIDSLKETSTTPDGSPSGVKPTTIILDGAINLAENLIAEDGSIALRITQEAFSKELCYRFQKALVRAVLPFPEGAGKYLGQYQWRACCPELLRHRPSYHRTGGLRVLEPSSGA